MLKVFINKKLENFLNLLNLKNFKLIKYLLIEYKNKKLIKI